MLTGNETKEELEAIAANVSRKLAEINEADRVSKLGKLGKLEMAVAALLDEAEVLADEIHATLEVQSTSRIYGQYDPYSSDWASSSYNC